jgi:hypothetical protein
MLKAGRSQVEIIMNKSHKFCVSVRPLYQEQLVFPQRAK